MLIANENTINAKYKSTISNDSINIKGMSIVYDNNWISFLGTVFKVKSYISSVLVSPRTKFFNNRDNAICLIVGLNKNGEIKVSEGLQVKYSGNFSVPFPEIVDIVPLIGIILVQDGSSNLIDGFKSLTQENIIFFSGTGNVVEKNQIGNQGEDNTLFGETGLVGYMGITGSNGNNGLTGIIGPKGISIIGEQGTTGINGLTGINWDIWIPFDIVN